jgi:hypothetical protein
MPKSGTHLLDSILRLMPPIRRQERAWLNRKLTWHPYNWLPVGAGDKCLVGIGRPRQVRRAALAHALGRIRPWRYAMGQLPHQPVLMELIEAHGLVPIVVVRDPRDVIVSLMHHSLDKPKHFMHREMVAFGSDAQRLAAIITGMTNAKGERREGLAAQLDLILGWTEDSRVLTLRFEDLVGERGGGSDLRQREAISCLAQWLDYPLDEGRAAEIGEQMFGTGRTFRKGTIGGWADYFDTELTELLEREVGDRMRQLGYSG